MQRSLLALLATLGSVAPLAPAPSATLPVRAPHARAGLAVAAAGDVEIAGSLRPGRPQAIVLKPGDLAADAWRISVPPDVTGMRLWTSGATGDVELYLEPGAPPDDAAGAWWIASDNTWVDESLFVEASDLQPLYPGEWYVQVVAAERPGGSLEKVTAELHVELVRPPRVDLTLGTAVEVVLDRAHGLRAAFDVKLPTDLAADEGVVLEVRGGRADVNLVAGPAEAEQTLVGAFVRGDSALAYERVVVPAKDLAKGLALHVFAYQEFERVETLPVRVLATRSSKAGRGLCPSALLGEPRPSVASPDSPLGPALDATVVVFGPRGSGSGFVLSADGLIVTNAHVVSGAPVGAPLASGRPALAVGFSTDPKLAPEPVFGAVLIDYREELDLALLQISGDLAGRPLEAETSFPHLAPGELGPPDLGGVVFGLGYPMTGGSGTMVTLTVTRGVFSGFAPEAEGVLYKIDAGIHAGVSGGPCVDGAGRLIGVANSSITDSNHAGGLGFVIPLELFPQSWLERAR